MSWDPELDTLEVRIPSLHFGSVRRGRVMTGTEFFTGGNFGDFDKFVPRDLTKRTIVSKYLSVFDLQGKLIPVTARMKRDVRTVLKKIDD